MTQFVIDSSIAIKWVVSEEDSEKAASLLPFAPFAAPELLSVECANILWKKVRLSQLTREEATLAAELLEQADIEYYPMRALLEPATRLAIALDHPAYDCVYLELGRTQGCRFVTADTRLINKVQECSVPGLGSVVLSLADAAAEMGQVP